MLSEAQVELLRISANDADGLDLISQLTDLNNAINVAITDYEGAQHELTTGADIITALRDQWDNIVTLRQQENVISTELLKRSRTIYQAILRN